MSGFRLFVCVDGSPAALAAVRLALALATEHGGEIRAVSVVENHDTARRLDVREHLRGEPAADRLERSARSVLDRIASMGAARDVPLETGLLHGEALREILRDARRWNPDLVLVGRSGRSGPGSPMLGSLAMHVVEFAEWPVVVVPEKPVG